MGTPRSDRFWNGIASASLVPLVFAPPLWLAFFQVVNIPGLSGAMLAYGLPLLQALFVIAVWRLGSLNAACSVLPRLAIYAGMAWLVLGLISAIAGPLWAPALAAQGGWIVWALFLVSLIAWVRAEPDRGRRLLEMLLAGFVTYAIVLHAMIYAVDDPDYPWSNALPGFANVRHLGYYALAALAASYLPMLKAGFDWRRAAGAGSLVLTALCWAILLWTGSRGPLIALAVVIILFAVFGIIPRSKRIFSVSIIAIVLGLAWSLLIAVPDPNLGVSRFFSTVELDGFDAAGASRWPIWLATIDGILDRPFLGYGPGLFSAVIEWTTVPNSHPHNVLLQALMDWGILGGACFLFAGILVFRQALQVSRRLDHPIPEKSAALLMAYLVAVLGMLDGTFYHVLPLTSLAVGLAIALANGSDVEAIPSLRRAVNVVAASGGVLLLAGAVSAGLMAWPGQPRIDDTRVKLVRLFPAQMTAISANIVYGRWIDNWHVSGIEKEKLLDQLDWLDQYSAFSDINTLVAARRSCFLGRVSQFRIDLERVTESKFDLFRSEAKRIEEIYKGVCEAG